MGILKAPTKMTSLPERHSSTKYCNFHRVHGHDIEQYIELRKEIKNAIRKGLLKDFIVQQADQREEHRKKGEQEYRHQKASQ